MRQIVPSVRGALHKQAASVGIEKRPEICYLLAYLVSGVGIADQERPLLILELVGIGDDVLVEIQHIMDGAEGAVRLDAHACGLGDEV